MSRRKQTKPQHLPSDEDPSSTISVNVKSETPPGHSCVSDQTSSTLRITTDIEKTSSGSLSDSQILNSCQGRLRRDRKAKRSSGTERVAVHQSDRICTYCGVKRNSPADLLRHLRKHTGEQPFSCSLCTRAFKAKRSLQYHQYMNHGIEFNGGSGCVRLNKVNQQKLDVVDRRESDHRPGLGQCSPLSSAGSLDDSFHSAPEMKETPSWFCGTMPSGTLEPYSLGRESQDHGIPSNGEDHSGTAQCLEPHPSLSYRPCVEPPSPDDSQASAILTPQESPEAYNEDTEEDKFSSQLSRRTCQFCSKVCPKPSDLKRHLMVHTGERPFKCDMCGKGFKAKGSMQYHQKAAHGLDIELSQGLEERYLRLKHRTCTLQKEPVNLSTDNTPINSPGNCMYIVSGAPPGNNGPMESGVRNDSPFRIGTPPARVINDTSSVSSHIGSGFLSDTTLEGDALSNKCEEENLNDRNNDVPTDLSSPQDLSSKKYDSLSNSKQLLSTEEKACEKKNGDVLLQVEKSRTETSSDAKTECIETEEKSHGQTEEGSEILKKDTSFIRNRISIKNETVLVTRLDGFNLISGVKTSLYKCHMCGKMFNYLSRLQCHLSVHFERHMTTYQCSICCANFKFKTQLLRHSRFHTRTKKSDDVRPAPEPQVNGPVRSNSLSDNELYDGEVKEEEVEIAIEHSSLKTKRLDSSHTHHSNKRPPRRYHRINGMYSCLFCKKTFFRLFSLQRHERMHTGVKPCYCKECGKGFSEPRNLRQHILRFHNEGFQMDFVRKARRRAIIASFRSSARSIRSADSSEKDDQQCSRVDSCCIRHDIDGGENKSPGGLSAVSPSAKDLSKKEEFDDDVMVVMPAEAPSGPRCDSHSLSWSGDEGEVNTEIMAAPKRPLLSFRKDGFSCKSRRKSSVPVKIENMSPPHHTDCSGKLDLNDEMPTNLCKTSVKEEPSSPALSVSSNAASTPLSPVLFSNSLGLGHGTGPTHPLFLSSHLLPSSGLSVNPVMSIPITVQVPVDPNAAASSSQSQASMGLMAQVSPNDFLVGYPRVKWEGNPLAGVPSSEPIPRRRSLAMETNYSLHSALMADKNGISSDGRKVTSLSRTHSRLHVVNAPVNREKVCKPMLLPDGRSIYRCVFCNKDFPTYSDINRHMDFHEDIRPYKCKFCDYYARTNSQLKVHMMRHQGIREFCCKLCNYKGVTQSDLNRHMKSQIHMLKSRNECPHCMEGFVTPKNLERHIIEICQGRKRSEKPA